VNNFYAHSPIGALILTLPSHSSETLKNPKDCPKNVIFFIAILYMVRTGIEKSAQRFLQDSYSFSWEG